MVKDPETGLLGVNVWGNIIPARYADPVYLVAGDPVLVDITSRGATGQSEAVVVCKLTDRPRPARGKVTVVPVDSTTITVLGEDGVTYQAAFAGSYVVGNWVFLNWTAGTPTVVGKVSETEPPPPPPPDPVKEDTAPPPPPPPKAITGTARAAATWSGTFVSQFNIWDNWAGGNQNLFQGSAYGPPLTGAWFYGSRVRALNDGRKIRRLRIKLGSRRSVGNYNASATLHIYTHRSSSRPSGNVSLDDGPFNVTLPARASARYVDLPLSFAARLLAGGGIAISGDPYMSLSGRILQPESGLLVIDWEK